MVLSSYVVKIGLGGLVASLGQVKVGELGEVGDQTNYKEGVCRPVRRYGNSLESWIIVWLTKPLICP